MILYEGPSLLDPEVDIVVIATEDSNPKTGRMLYTWILRQDRAPEVAAYDGSDDAICGDCKFRTQLVEKQFEQREHDPKLPMPQPKWAQMWEPSTRTCYVRLSPAEGADEALPPSEVWRAWKAGEWDDPWGKGLGQWSLAGLDPDTWNYIGPLPVRIGSYGDPAAVPTRVWAELLRYVTHWTGYSHFWKPRKCSVCNQS